MCQGLMKSYGGLLASRFILGALEAGLMPGAALLIAQYYTRHEFPIHFALFLWFALGAHLREMHSVVWVFQCSVVNTSN
jgi:MFS family permease